MRIVSVSEDKKIEKRIAITPEIAKKYIALGFELSLSENYGEHLGFKDSEYKELGAKLQSAGFEFNRSFLVVKNLEDLLILEPLRDQKKNYKQH